MTIDISIAHAELSGEDAARARCYALLGAVLAAPPSAEVLSALASMQGDDSELGRALAAAASAARRFDVDVVRREYDDLFIGVSRGELVPYASYYLTGFLNEKPLAVLRVDMARLGAARAAGSSEPEDHIASICQTMAGLISGAFGPAASLVDQRRFFSAHLAPWAGRFFDDLERAKSAELFRPVGAIGKALLEIERDAFALAA